MNKKQKEMFEKRKAEIEKERKSLYEQIERGAVSVEDADKKVSELKQRKMQLDQDIDQAEAPVEERGAQSVDCEEIRSAMIERRSITIGTDLGAHLFVKEVLTEMQEKTPLLNIGSTYIGTNARTTIPAFAPSLAEPVGVSEGKEGISKDTKANLKAVELLPHPFISILPVSTNTLKLGAVDFEKELPRFFAQAFSKSFHRQIFQGKGESGKQFEGFAKMTFDADKKMEAKTASVLKVTDLAELALTVADKSDNACILLHPSVYTKILAESPTKDLSAAYIKTLTENKTIEGVKVILTSHMLKETTAGAVAAIAGELDRYGIGIASEIDITPKTIVGDLNVYFEAAMYAAGKPLSNDFYALIAK